MGAAHMANHWAPTHVPWGRQVDATALQTHHDVLPGVLPVVLLVILPSLSCHVWYRPCYVHMFVLANIMMPPHLRKEPVLSLATPFARLLQLLFKCCALVNIACPLSRLAPTVGALLSRGM
jgi:hypothetical protein